MKKIVRSFLPNESNVPIIISLSHNGSLLPNYYNYDKPLTGCSSSDVFINATNYGATVVRALFHKSFVDLCKSPVGVKKTKNKIICEAIPTRDSIEKKINGGLKTVSAINGRMKSFFWPYYSCIDEQINHLKKDSKSKILLVDIHEMHELKGKKHVRVSCSDKQADQDIAETFVSAFSSQGLRAKCENSSEDYLLNYFSNKYSEEVVSVKIEF